MKSEVPRALGSSAFYLLAAFLLWTASDFPVLGQATYGVGIHGKLVPENQYELRFLGTIISEGSHPKDSHQGLFLFTWKGPGSTTILGYGFDYRNRFHPCAPGFSVRGPDGWKVLPVSFDATGSGLTHFPPGHWAAMVVDVIYLEEMTSQTQKVLENADSAVLRLFTPDGYLISNEFPLPLLPTAEAAPK